MGRLFWAQTAFSGIPLCADSLARSCREMMEQELLLVAPAKVGLCGAVGLLSSPLYANRDVRVAGELFWWVDEAARGSGVGVQLLEKIEQQAVAKGIHLLSMMTLESVNPQASGALYERAGYRLSEHTYHKQVGRFAWD